MTKHPAPKRRRKKKARIRVGRVLLLILLLIVIIAAAVGVVLYSRWTSGLKPVSSQSEKVLYHVDSSRAAKDTYMDLEKQGIIRDGEVAYYYGRYNDLNGILAGDFELDKSMSVDEILRTLNDPTKIVVDDVAVTIVEGDWAKHIAAAVASVTNVTEEELMSLWNNKEYIRSLMPKYPFLTEEMFQEDVRIYMEGYLAPNTYRFYKDTTAEEVTERLLDQTEMIYEKYEDDFRRSELSTHEIFTLASIVQYECGNTSEMAKIAGVFYNRMEVGMNLGSSSSVCYALDINKDGDWRECEYNYDYDSPYNTYQNLGLPPGPIENAGEEAFVAVLYPDRENDYLFFLSDVCTDGKMYYSQTFEEHDRKVAEYLTCY